MSNKEDPFFVKDPGLPPPPKQQPANPDVRDEDVSSSESTDTEPRRYRGWVPNVRWDVV